MRDYERHFQRTADAMCELDGDSRIVRANPSCRSLLALGDDATARLVDRFEAAAREPLLATLRRLDDGDPTAVVEGRLLARDTWTSWQVTLVDDGRFLAVGRDVSAHRETENALAQKSSFLHSIIEAEPECVKLVAADGELLDMNAAGLRMIGARDRDEAIGANVYDLMAPEDRDRFVAFNERVCHGEGGELSFDIIGLDGTRRSMETTAVPLPRTADGELLHLAITRDVSERHQLESQLRQSQKMEAIGQLAGGVAHDFNNLLTAIIGSVEVALLELDEGSVVADDLRQIRVTSERAARLTQKLLAFARRQVAQLEVFSLADLVDNAEELLERVLGESFELELTVDRDTPNVRADRGHMEQVLVNLVVNARDALGRGGVIRVRVAVDEVPMARAIRLGCNSGPHVLLAVHDDGPGIADDVLQHIFDPFFTTKPQGVGTGLGLSTCYGIVAQLGGAIDVHSVVGEGTTFSVLVPVAHDDETAPPTDGEPVRGSGQLVVVVEDEEVVRRAIARMLKVLGYTVESFASGEEALARWHEVGEVKLLVTDMAMPGISGPRLAGELAARTAGLRVLYMTGYLPNRVADERVTVDEAEVLHKPFTNTSLARAVSAAIQRPLPSRL